MSILPLLKGAEAAGDDFEGVVSDRDAAVTVVVSFEDFGWKGVCLVVRFWEADNVTTGIAGAGDAGVEVC